MREFNLQKAYELENLYVSERNIKGLAEINIEFCEKLASSSTFSTRLPKVCFYLGRLRALSELEAFLERNKNNFIVLDYDTYPLIQKCFKYGVEYEDMSTETLNEIREYFANPRYSELFTSMMFDYQEYLKDIYPFNFSIREVRQSNFPQELIEEVGQALLIGNPDLYYERTKNRVVEIYDYEETIRGVHFPLNFTHVTRKHFGEVIHLLLEKLNITDSKYESILLEELLEEDAGIADMLVFNGDIDAMVISLLKHRPEINLGNAQLKQEISRILSTEFLEFLNSNSR